MCGAILPLIHIFSSHSAQLSRRYVFTLRYLITGMTDFNLPSIVRAVTSKRMSWAGHVVHVKKEMYIILWSGSLKGTEHLGGLGIDGRMILKWILQKEGVKE